jgi:hypothetical protein
VAMKRTIAGLLLLAVFSLIAPGSGSQTIAIVRVPDAATALKIAERTLIQVYGKRQIDDERPLRQHSRTASGSFMERCVALIETDVAPMKKASASVGLRF